MTGKLFRDGIVFSSRLPSINRRMSVAPTTILLCTVYQIVSSMNKIDVSDGIAVRTGVISCGNVWVSKIPSQIPSWRGSKDRLLFRRRAVPINDLYEPSNTDHS